MADSRRDRLNRRDKSPYHADTDERRYIELLREVKADKGQLEREIASMQEKRVARKEKAKYLLQEIDMLKGTLTSLRKNKEVSVRQLKSEMQRLREAKRQSFSEDGLEQKREEYRPRPQRASVSSVPVYDRKVYKGPSKERTRRGDRGFDLPSSLKGSQSPRRRRASSHGTRRARIHQSPRGEIQITQDKIEAAAQAFLDIFGQLRPKVIRSLWMRSDETEEKGKEKVLHTSNLGPFLHGLVVHAFRHDNPDHPAPSVRRTKPLVTLLKSRLVPYIEKKKYLELEHFKMFAFWLEKPDMLQQKGDHIMRSADKLTAADIDRRRQLKYGSECLIWSDGLQSWCEGQVINVKYDEQGEWLVVRYNDDSTDKEVQRYSKLLKVPRNMISDKVMASDTL